MNTGGVERGTGPECPDSDGVHLFGDTLTCPSCQTRKEAANRAHHDRLHQPAVKEVDMAARLGPGWTLRQRDGDAEVHQWLVTYQGEVKGMVRRYRRKTGGGDGWSKGWEALLSGTSGFVRHSATSAACGPVDQNVLQRFCDPKISSGTGSGRRACRRVRRAVSDDDSMTVRTLRQTPIGSHSAP